MAATDLPRIVRVDVSFVSQPSRTNQSPRSTTFQSAVDSRTADPNNPTEARDASESRTTSRCPDAPARGARLHDRPRDGHADDRCCCCSGPTPPSAATCRWRAVTRTASRPTPPPRPASPTTSTTSTRTTPTGRSARTCPAERSEPSPVNQAWSGSGTDPRLAQDHGLVGRVHDRAASRAGLLQCVRDQRSMLDPRTARCASARPGARNAKRSLVATFRRKSFLDYLYFTDYETLDPAAYSDRHPALGERELRQVPHGEPSLTVHGHPVRHRRRGRGSAAHERLDPDVRQPGLRPHCSRQHRGIGARPGWWDTGGCRAARTSRHLEARLSAPGMPTSNNSLANVALPAYRFTGTTPIRVRLEHERLEQQLSPKTQTMPFPSNGVIYVRNGNCGTSYRSPDLQRPAGMRQRLHKRHLFAGPHPRERERHRRRPPADRRWRHHSLRRCDARPDPEQLRPHLSPGHVLNNNQSCTNASGRCRT